MNNYDSAKKTADDKALAIKDQDDTMKQKDAEIEDAEEKLRLMKAARLKMTEQLSTARDSHDSAVKTC